MIRFTSVTRRGLALASQLLDHELASDDPRPAGWIVRDWPASDRAALQQARAWMRQESTGEPEARIRARCDDPAPFTTKCVLHSRASCQDPRCDGPAEAAARVNGSATLPGLGEG